MKRERIGILVTGSGFFDGTSPWEIPFILHTIESKGVYPVAFAPDIHQQCVVNHLSGKETKEKRNCLVEGARIIRGNIQRFEDISPDDIDALIVPGGKGLLYNLTTYSINGVDCEIYPPLRKLIRVLYLSGKPLGGMGYGSTLIALALEKLTKPIINPGEDLSFKERLERNGTILISLPPDEVVIDDENNIFTTTGITPSGSILKGSVGITNLVEGVIEAKKKRRKIDEKSKIK